MADEPTPPTTPTAPPPAPTEPAKPATGDELGDAGKQAIDRMKAERNEAQKVAKAAQKELEDLRKTQMSDSEKAVNEAKEQGRNEALTTIGSRLVDAEFRAAAVGRVLTPEALLDFDRAAFLGNDGDVNRDQLVKWVEENSTPLGNKPIGTADGGARGGDTKPDPGPGASRLRAAYANTNQ